jgi:ABC-2 type transport system permease protein
LRIKWAPHLFSLEIRKMLTYRLDFWAQFIGPVLTSVVLAFFLWRSIFNYRDVESMGGFSFNALMLYYLLVPLVDRIVRGYDWKAGISLEIYDGSLTRYMVYPISYFSYKFVTYLADSLLRSLQLLLGLGLFILFFGLPSDTNLSTFSVTLAIIAALMATLLYFWLAAAVEMIAFWADNVWTLLVILRFTIFLLGGGMIPISLFPGWSIRLLELSPFPYFISFPVLVLMGQTDIYEFFRAGIIMALWTLFFASVSAQVWRRGLLQYTGVGI